MAKGDRPRAEVAFHELPVGSDLGSIDYELSEEVVGRHLRATHQTPYPPGDGPRLAPERDEYAGPRVRAGPAHPRR